MICMIVSKQADRDPIRSTRYQVPVPRLLTLMQTCQTRRELVIYCMSTSVVVC